MLRNSLFDFCVQCCSILDRQHSDVSVKLRRDPHIKGATIRFVRFFSGFFAKCQIIIYCCVELLLDAGRRFTFEIDQISNTLDFTKKHVIFGTVLHFGDIPLVF